MPPFDPSAAEGDLEDITGAFEIEVVARFDDLLSGYWQRVLDIGNGPAQNNILLTQVENTSDISFELFQGDDVYRVTAGNAIVEGEVATWTIGVDPGGLMYIEKDGARLAEASGVVPGAMLRANELLGRSNWVEDSPLDGAVLGIDVTQDGEASDGGFLNEPVQINGAFKMIDTEPIPIKWHPADLAKLEQQQKFTNISSKVVVNFVEVCTYSPF